MSDGVLSSIPHLGDAAIWAVPKVGFLSPRKIPPAAIMKCYDWVTEMRDQGVCVMGGFQSPLENVRRITETSSRERRKSWVKHLL